MTLSTPSQHQCDVVAGHIYTQVRVCGTTHSNGQVAHDSHVELITQVGTELSCSHPDKFGYERIAIDDHESEDLLARLPRIFKFMQQAQAAEGVTCAGQCDISGRV